MVSAFIVRTSARRAAMARPRQCRTTPRHSVCSSPADACRPARATRAPSGATASVHPTAWGHLN